MQLGFVIDHERCIGCHACTVACKSENDVQLGSFRTWVKYTETGTFPEVRRHFAVLRCNQCTDAPCVTICPTSALEKRPDGIVDVTRDHCIGCKSCMQGCPYDALYISESTGTAEKCHFCAHRTERGLAPACAIVCPTEAIIPGDFHDPNSRVSRMRAAGKLQARKLEAGTGPNVLYREVDPSGIRPLETNGAGGYLWSTPTPGPQRDAELFAALDARAKQSARTTYDIPKNPVWGAKVSAYLLTKSIAAGAFTGALPLLVAGEPSLAAKLALPIVGLVFLALTALLLVADLRRPERFLLILKRPNWSSWLVRGTVVLMAYGGLLVLWLVLGASGADVAPLAAGPLGWLSAVAGALTACYTAWLFRQAKGRVLWMQRALWLQLAWQAIVAGGATGLALAPLVGASAEAAFALRVVTAVGLILHLAHLSLLPNFAPKGREEEFARVVALVRSGPFAARRRRDVVVLGGFVALLLLAIPHPLAGVAAAALALWGLHAEEDVLVRAGQALPIS